MSTAVSLQVESGIRPDGDRIGLSKDALERAFLDNLYYIWRSRRG